MGLSRRGGIGYAIVLVTAIGARAAETVAAAVVRLTVVLAAAVLMCDIDGAEYMVKAEALNNYICANALGQRQNQGDACKTWNEASDLEKALLVGGGIVGAGLTVKANALDVDPTRKLTEGV